MSNTEGKIRDLYRRLSRPLAAEPTGLLPVLGQVEGIKAVVFDVYGTLICSGVGDISLIEQSDRNELLRDLVAKYGGRLREDVADPSAAFHGLIKADHAASRARGIGDPEVDIVEIWRRFFAQCANAKFDDETVRMLAAEYECVVNPVWPYPELVETLVALKSAGLPLGIVSNAQFYTPLMLEAFTGFSLAESGFDERLLVWSFEHHLGKPSVELYREQARRLQETRGIAPGKCLYVGNDMLKDVWAAAEIGFQTVLFAGDERSLRMRADDGRCQGLKADRVVTELGQITGLLGR